MNIPAKNSIKRFFHAIGFYKNFVPAAGKVRFGDLYRTRPLSTRFGYDRGGPIDRFYIEQFLESNKTHIRGRVLEVADNNYTRMFGVDVTQSDILFVNDTNPKATIIMDLSKPLGSYHNTFDCIILTQTLQFVYDSNQAIENCYNLLKPGGHILVTVPGISNIGKDPWKWYWSFSTFSISQLLCRKFENEKIVVHSHGNVLAASAFLYGMGRADVNREELMENDKLYQVIITAIASK